MPHSKRHNILHLIDTGGPGGAEVVYRNILLGLDERRWKSVPAIPEDDWLAASLRAGGITPVIVESGGSFDLPYVYRLHRLARTSGAHLIHAHLLASSVYGTVVAALRGIPIICTFHGVNDVNPQERYAAPKFRILRRRRNHFVFVSDALRREFLEHVNVQPARMSVIHNGIDTSTFQVGRDGTLRAELGLRDDDVLIGAVGNIRWWKAYDILLRAAALLKERQLPYRIVIIGQTGGPLYEELVALHAELGLGDMVKFLGLRGEIHRLMRNFDIYVTSSSDEGFSLTTVEAMASGLPVVATRSGGPEEIIEQGRSGVLVPRNAPEELANALQALAADSARRATLAVEARKRAESAFSIPAMARGYHDLYERLLSTARTPA